jgi:hypothetical protein
MTVTMILELRNKSQKNNNLLNEEYFSTDYQKIGRVITRGFSIKKSVEKRNLHQIFPRIKTSI